VRIPKPTVILLALGLTLAFPCGALRAAGDDESAATAARRALETLLHLGSGTESSLDGFFVFDLPGGGPRVRGIYAAPPGPGPHPALVLNHAVAAAEYRGEGESAGQRDYADGDVADVLRLVDWLGGREDVDAQRIAMVGYSRGGTVALLAASRGAAVRAVVAYSPVTDLETMLAEPGRVAGILDRHELAFDRTDPAQVKARNPLRHVGEIRSPLLLLHGAQDPLIPVAQSTTFAQAVKRAGGDAQVQVFEQAAHHLKSSSEAFSVARTFLSSHVPLATASMHAGRDEAVSMLQQRRLPIPPDDPYAGVARGGLFQRMSWVDMTKRRKANLHHPLLAGIDFNAPWAIIEPADDGYDWSWIDEPLQIWAGAGKKCGINIVTLQPRGKSPHAGHATPGWVFEKGAKKATVATRGKGITGGMTADYQLFWDPIYLREYEDFVRALAERYDGDPRVEVIGIGVAKLGGLTVVDPKISNQERQELLAFYRSNGWSRERWFQTIQEIGLMYRRHFKQTPVRFNLSNFFDKKDTSAANLAYFEKVSDWAGRNGIHLIYQGISGGPHYAQKMRNKPIDAIFHRNSARILTGAEPVDPIYRRKGDFMGTIEENVDHALGTAPGLETTNISWLNFYLTDCAVSNPLSRHFDERWYRAFYRAWQSLRLIREPEPSRAGTAD
jgi:dienelactone hydrolase